MKTFENILNLTIKGNKISIDGVTHKLDNAIDVYAVQFHKNGKLLEEKDGVFTEVEQSKYQYALDIWNAQQDLILNPPALSNEELQQQKIIALTNEIDTFIQSKIDEYNQNNGVMFENINSIYKYTADTSYTHYAFCQAITLWNIQVWETARQIQIDVLAGTRAEPTESELLAELPALSY